MQLKFGLIFYAAKTFPIKILPIIFKSNQIDDDKTVINGNLADMYIKRDQFVIPFTCTFCGNLVTTKANLSSVK